MSIVKILDSLEISWKRDEILTKINNGHSTDEIINEFLIKNKTFILLGIIYLYLLFNTFTSLDYNLSYLRNEDKHYKLNEEELSLSNKISINKISLFMVNWSNKIVIISLITITAIALSKQAWA